MHTGKRSERVKESTPITIENFPRVQYHPWETAAGYNPLRGEFATEWNSHVEDDLHTLSFLPSDSENDRGLLFLHIHNLFCVRAFSHTGRNTVIKYNALTAYYRIIQERSRRTRLIVERNLLQYSATESWDKSTLLGMGAGAAEATALAARLRVFMQIMAREEFKSLLEGIAQDRRVCAEIARLKALRVRGVRALNERAAPGAASAYVYASAGAGQPPPLQSPQTSPPPGKKARHEGGGSVFSVAGLPGAHLLGDDERRLCEERRLSPAACLALRACAVREQQAAGAVSVARVAAAAQQPRDVVEAALALFHRAGWIARPVDDARDAKAHKKKKHKHRDSRDQAAAAATVAAAAALGTAPGLAFAVPTSSTGTAASVGGAAGGGVGVTPTANSNSGTGAPAAVVSVTVPSVPSAGTKETKHRHRAVSSGATSTATAAALAAAAALDSVGASLETPIPLPAQGPPQPLPF